MSYTIHYDVSGDVKITKPDIVKKRKRIKFIVNTVIIIGVIVYAIYDNWLLDIFLPGYDSFTEEAAKNLLQNIRNGETVGEAVTAFCREVVANAR